MVGAILVVVVMVGFVAFFGLCAILLAGIPEALNENNTTTAENEKKQQPEELFFTHPYLYHGFDYPFYI